MFQNFRKSFINFLVSATRTPFLVQFLIFTVLTFATTFIPPVTHVDISAKIFDSILTGLFLSSFPYLMLNVLGHRRHRHRKEA